MTAGARKFNAVCFDCDSTLSSIEGIDELGRRAGCEAEIAELTTAAMDGCIALDGVYGRRLERLRPDRMALAWLGDRYLDTIVPGARETIDQLHRCGVAVYVLSGGIFQPIAALAAALGIQNSRVHAVEVYLDAAGGYRDFATASPLCRNDGKAVVCREIAARHGSVAMVGDGMTDLNARSGGAFIVGYGGVVRREVMERGADVFVSTPSLTGVLGALLQSDARE